MAMSAGRGNLVAGARSGASDGERGRIVAGPERASPMAVARLRDARLVTGSRASGAVPAPGTTLVAGSDSLDVLDTDGTRLRSWPWSEIQRWDADGLAPDADGHVRQVLTFRTEGGPLAVQVDAGQLGDFLPRLARIVEENRLRVARERRRRVRSGDAGQRSAGRRIAAAAASVALAGGLAGGLASLAGHPAATHGRRQVGGALDSAFGSAPIHLPTASAAPAPAPPALAASRIASHEAFGFLPYWALPDPASIDMSGLTTVAYFSLDVNPDGTVDESPSSSGWVGYQSQALANFVTEAHHNGQRAVLTATCFDQAALDALTHDPSAQSTLASTLVTLVRAKNLDGVNLDFEGTGATDRIGLDQLVATVSNALRRADPAWQFTVDTYASSAADPKGFYDVAGMAPYVDAFVVMAYDMGSTFSAGPTAPTTGSGFNDQETLASYSSAAGPGKVILAMPLYGEDWPTTGPTAGDPSTGPPTPVADDQIAAADTLYWDPSTGGPWAVYRVGHQWHQVWFDDPASLAAKFRLAQAAGLRGEALWALGMAAGTGDQQAAFSGVVLAPQPPDGPVTLWRGPVPGGPLPSGGGGQPGPPGPTSLGSAAVAGNFGSGGAGAAPPAARGVFDGVDVALVPWPGAVPAATTGAGSLGSFAAPGTSVACLATGAQLPVEQIDGTSAFIVTAAAPVDCAAGVWAFVLPAGSAVGATPSSTRAGTGAGAPSTTTTTAPAPSTTTTTSTTSTTTTTTTTATTAG
jgi:hypothetical protein